MEYKFNNVFHKFQIFSIISCAGSTYLNRRNEKLKSCLFEIMDDINQKGKASNFEMDNTVIILGDSGVRDIVGFNTTKAIHEANFEPFGVVSIGKALDIIKKMWRSPEYSYGDSIAAIVLLSDGVFDYESENALAAFNSIEGLKDINRMAAFSDVYKESDEYENLSRFAGDRIFDVSDVRDISDCILNTFFDGIDTMVSNEPEIIDGSDLHLETVEGEELIF